MEIMELDNNRASLHEISLVVILAILATLLRNFIYSFSEQLSRSKLIYVVDFLLGPVFTLLVFTVLPEHMNSAFAILSACCFLAALLNLLHGINYFPGVWTILRSPFPSSLPFLSNARAYINLMSCVSILAVDFSNLFHHRYRKTHNYGTGLMDVGVGMFIAAHGITSRFARRDSPVLSGWSEYWKVISTEVRGAIPLFFLGLARLAVVTVLHKNSPLHEYGTHWNFFFTIGCVRVLGALILPLLPQRISVNSCIVASIICILYQYWLVKHGLREFILHAERGGLYSSNREGIYSCVGFTALYLFSVGLGAAIFSERKTVTEWSVFSLFMVCLSLLVWGLLYININHIEPISRRLTNMPYILWMVGLTLLVLTVFLIFDIITIFISSMRECKSDKIPDTSHNSTNTTSQDVTVQIERSSTEFQIVNKNYYLSSIIQAIDYNQLAYFLLGNILTGLVNILVDTEDVPTIPALCYLIVYEFILSYFVLVLYRKKMKIKLL